MRPYKPLPCIQNVKKSVPLNLISQHHHHVIVRLGAGSHSGGPGISPGQFNGYVVKVSHIASAFSTRTSFFRLNVSYNKK